MLLVFSVVVALYTGCIMLDSEYEEFRNETMCDTGVEVPLLAGPRDRNKYVLVGMFPLCEPCPYTYRSRVVIRIYLICALSYFR